MQLVRSQATPIRVPGRMASCILHFAVRLLHCELAAETIPLRCRASKRTNCEKNCESDLSSSHWPISFMDWWHVEQASYPVSAALHRIAIVSWARPGVAGGHATAGRRPSHAGPPAQRESTSALTFEQPDLLSCCAQTLPARNPCKECPHGFSSWHCKKGPLQLHATHTHTHTLRCACVSKYPSGSPCKTKKTQHKINTDPQSSLLAWDMQCFCSEGMAMSTLTFRRKMPCVPPSSQRTHKKAPPTDTRKHT